MRRADTKINGHNRMSEIQIQKTRVRNNLIVQELLYIDKESNNFNSERIKILEKSQVEASVKNIILDKSIDAEQISKTNRYSSHTPVIKIASILFLQNQSPRSKKVLNPKFRKSLKKIN